MHALLVHVSIWLLIAYSLVEVATAFDRVFRTRNSVTIFKFVLVATGVIVVGATLGASIWAEYGVRAINPHGYIMRTYAIFAGLTMLMYVALAAAYGLRMVAMTTWGKTFARKRGPLALAWRMKIRLTNAILDTTVAPILALLGLLFITITSGLDVAIVYGPDINPFVHFVYGVFFA